MQINPHFLFNTLNLISQTAYVEGADQTSALLDSTSALLRYTLDNASREVSIYRELEILDIYVSILEKRFAGRIRFFFDLDERFHDQKVPALIFQPLVENAINHGVGMYLEGGEVHICTEYFPDRNRGRICVWDNGAGLSQDEAKEVNQRMKEVKEGEARIGLANVYARLQAFFQGRATMEIYSEPAVRTQIVIEIPVDETVRAQIVGEMPADDAIRAQIATDIPADDAVRAQIVAEMPSDDAVRAQIATDIPADEGKA